MQCFLLRHAPAVERGTPGYLKDSSRPLTEEGRKKMRQIAAGMKTLGLAFDLILTSSYVRARQTADIVAGVFKMSGESILSQNLAPGGNGEALAQELINHGGKSILLVGHEPDLSRFISVLVTGDTGLGLTMKKGGLCKLELQSPHFGRCGTLSWLLT
ncbi:MAG TPA: phosphohistidine phosphatase SixA, partial [Verrucomicrobiae bacterium]